MCIFVLIYTNFKNGRRFPCGWWTLFTDFNCTSFFIHSELIINGETSKTKNEKSQCFGGYTSIDNKTINKVWKILYVNILKMIPWKWKGLKIQLIGNVNIPSFVCLSAQHEVRLPRGSRARLRALGALGFAAAASALHANIIEPYHYKRSEEWDKFIHL